MKRERYKGLRTSLYICSPSEEHHHEPRSSHGVREQLVLNDPEERVLLLAEEIGDTTRDTQHDQQVGHEKDSLGGVGSLKKEEKRGN